MHKSTNYTFCIHIWWSWGPAGCKFKLPYSSTLCPLAAKWLCPGGRPPQVIHSFFPVLPVSPCHSPKTDSFLLKFQAFVPPAYVNTKQTTEHLCLHACVRFGVYLACRCHCSRILCHIWLHVGMNPAPGVDLTNCMSWKKILKRCDRVIKWTSVRVAFTFSHTLTFFSSLQKSHRFHLS